MIQYYTHTLEYFLNIKQHPFIKFIQHGHGDNPCVIDRFGDINKLNYFKVESFNKINVDSFILPNEYDYNYLMNERANEVISLYNEIYISWSGGIDSTAALSSLLNNKNENEIHVIYSEESIRDNKQYYDFLCNGKHKNLYMHHISYQSVMEFIFKLPNNVALVTGEIADYIHGNNFSIKYPDIACKPFNSVLEDYIKNCKYLQAREYELLRNIDTIKEYINYYVSIAPFKVKNLYQCIFWLKLGLVFDGHTARYRTKMLKNENIFHFYATKKFQEWGLNNITTGNLNDKLTPLNYKIQNKIYTSTFTKNESYLLQTKTDTGVMDLGSTKNKKNALMVIIDDKVMTIDKLQFIKKKLVFDVNTQYKNNRDYFL